jgi:magnesium chelatase family protein
MSYGKVYGAQTHLLNGKIVTIEVDITKNTLHSFTLVGLPDKAVDESKDRMSSAIKNSGFQSPKNQNQKIVISLSPADLKKEGPYFDLAIALSYLLSSGEINFDPEGKLFLGELSLNGELRPIKGALPLTEIAKKLGYKEIYLPIENAEEAALIEGITIFGAKTLKEVIDHIDVIKKDKKISPPADYDASKAHVSVKKYAYGQMFFGEFYGVPKLNFRYPPKPRRLYLKPTLFEKACQKIYQIYQFIKTLLIGE